MKLAYHKQNWQGFFTYHDDEDHSDMSEEVPFSMELVFTENAFTGTAKDAESEDAFTEPALVKGFVEKNKISFVKNYPCFYYRDDSGNIALDKTRRHPEVQYLGYFDKEYQTVYGTWEMVLYVEDYLEKHVEAYISGDFEMQRSK